MLIARWRYWTRPLQPRPFAVAHGDEDVSQRLGRMARPGAPLWTITSHERPEACARLVASLGEAARRAKVEPTVLVVRDAGVADYDGVAQSLANVFGEHGVLIESTRHLGKRGFWEVHQQLMDAVRLLAPTSHLSLQDDAELAPGWYDEMWSIADSIDDPDLAVLYLSVMGDDEPDGRWIEFGCIDSPDGRSRKTQWFDLLAYLALPRMYDELGYRVRAVHPRRWRRNPAKSSGVGEQLTTRLFRRRANIYQVTKTLVYHGTEASLMNPEDRAGRPLDNRPRR